MGQTHLSIIQKERLLTLFRALKTYDKTLREAHKQGIHVSRSGLQKIILSYKKRGTLERRRGSGRPRKTNRAQDKQLRLMARRHRLSDLRNLARSWSVSVETVVSSKTVSRRLKEAGLARRPAIRKPALNAGQKERRAAFAATYKPRPLSFWKRVKFSDEKIFSSENDAIRVLVTRRSDESHHPSCFVGSHKYGLRAHVWALIGWDGVGPIRLVEGTLRSENYVEQIIFDLPDQLRISCWAGQPRAIFQQDLAPAHRARNTMNFLAASGVRLLDWPGNSPDLNPIEHVWNHVARRVRARGRPNTRAQLWQWVQEEWHATPLGVVRSLILSMPRRLTEVVANRGAQTHY